jgi:translation initiation factor eIF-2B subunit delta
LSEIDRYLQERIIAADQLIATYAVSKINNGDVVLTYGRFIFKQQKEMFVFV